MAGGMLADDASVDGAFGLQHDDGSLPCCSLTDVDAFPGRAASADVWVSEVLAAADLSPTHSHFLFLGMATVTSLHPQLLPRVWGHSFSGLPGLRTGTMTRSLAWLHVVERWPRMHGSQAIFWPLMSGMAAAGSAQMIEQQTDLDASNVQTMYEAPRNERQNFVSPSTTFAWLRSRNKPWTKSGLLVGGCVEWEIGQ